MRKFLVCGGFLLMCWLISYLIPYVLYVFHALFE